MRLLPALVLVLLPSLAAAQSMGDAAAKERERRRKAREAGEASVPVVTEKELKANPGKLANNPADAPAVPASSPAPTLARGLASTSSAEEESWRGRAAGLRARIDAARQQYESTREREFKGPYYRGESSEGLRLAVARAKQALEAAEKALQDLEDSARRQGIPPGWLR
jgi:hypothetical protein